MSFSVLASSQVPAPRVVLVMAGATGAIGRANTALEHATMPQLAALARAGRVGRLRTVASHLPVTEATAAAALLGTVPPMALDPGAVAVESLGRVLAADEVCTIVDVLDPSGEPAPALDVQRAVEAMTSQLPWHRIVGVRRGFQVLVAGTVPPVLPDLAGLGLRAADPGFLPSPQLAPDTVVVGVSGSTLLGVGALLGAQVRPIDSARGDRHDPLPARLRSATVTALVDGAHTVVVETQAPLYARRGLRDDASRQRALCTTLEVLDRELIGPLHAATGWTGAVLAVTADLPRTAAGRTLRDEVPIVMGGPRAVFLPEPAPLLAPLGTSLPPRYCERGVASLPVVSSPYSLIPARVQNAPRRFRRDPATGVTLSDEYAVV